MLKNSKKALVAELDRYIGRSNEIHAEYLGDAALRRRFAAFTAWQLAYLLPYFADMRARDEYRGAVDFVVRELAGTAVSERDRQLARAAHVATRVLPRTYVELLVSAARLNARTLEINLDVCRYLDEHGESEHGISERAYFAACRAVSSIEECEDLLDATLDLGKRLEPAVHSRFIGATLWAMHKPAHAAGFGALQTFFETGYHTFHQIPDIDRFLADIEADVSRVFDVVYRSPLGEAQKIAC